LMNVQHYESLAVRARVDETMLGLSDLLELKESLAEFAMYCGHTPESWAAHIDGCIDQSFAEICRGKSLNIDLSRRAAQLVASEADTPRLRSMVRDMSGVIFHLAERLQAKVDEQLFTDLEEQVKLLRAELHTLGGSASWRI